MGEGEWGKSFEDSHKQEAQQQQQHTSGVFYKIFSLSSTKL